MNNPSWENFGKIIDGISTAVIGLGVAMVALNASNPLGWVLTGIGIVAKLGKALGDLIKKQNEEKSAEERLTESTNKLRDARERLNEATNNYTNAVDRAEQAEKDLREAERQAGITAEELLKKMKLENLTYKDLDESQRNVYKRYLDNNSAQQQLNASLQELNKTQVETDSRFYETILRLKQASSSSEEYKKKVIDMYNSGKLSAEEATEAISLAMANMDKTTRQQFTRDIPDAIRRGLNPKAYASAVNRFTSWWNNNVIGKLSKTFSLSFNAKSAGKIFGFKSGGLVTKLASGGIINMPNRGVPISSAIGGEAGRERNNPSNRRPSNGNTRFSDRKTYNNKCSNRK